MVTAQQFPEMLWETIDEGTHLPEEVFNVDETGLYWKRIPGWSYLSKKEKLMPCYKAAKDRLTLFFGSASGNMKLKPLLVYHSEDPNPLKTKPKALFLLCGRVTQKPGFFPGHFPGLVYPRGNKILFGERHLIQHSFAPHQYSGPPSHSWITFIPTSKHGICHWILPCSLFIQPMDQGVTVTFKKYYLCHNFC